MLNDEQIRERGGNEEDIARYAHDVGYACGAIYGGTCDYCGKADEEPTEEMPLFKGTREALEKLTIKPNTP